VSKSTNDSLCYKNSRWSLSILVHNDKECSPVKTEVRARMIVRALLPSARPQSWKRRTTYHNSQPYVGVNTWRETLPSHNTMMNQRHVYVDDPVVEFGNSFGHIALWTMSFFLIAVARHSPLLSDGGLHKYHIWPGRIVVISGIFHGMVHLYRWKVKVGVSLISMVVPPLACWSGQGANLTPEVCLDQVTGCSCYHHFRNLAGFCATTGMAVIGLTSLYKVRRRFYRFFYLVHASVAPLTMLLLCLHFTRSLIYMAPSVLYYVACSFPVFAETILKWRKGVRILSCQRISDECVSFTFETSHEAMEQYKPGQHVLLRAPALSPVSHPFTVNRVFGESHELCITFRETGVFTKSLSAALLLDESNGSSPLIQLDGFHGSSQRLEDALRHDVVVMIAGGIGIVAYLSLLQDVISQSKRPNQIKLHWACRDAGLVQFIQREYLDRLLDRASELGGSFQIVIHLTSDPPDTSLPKQKSSETNTVDSDETPLRYTGEPFSPSNLQSRGYGRWGSIITYGLNISFGILISWYAYANALHEEDPAATVWCYVCVAGIGMYVLLMARKTESRYFAAFSFVVWSGLFFIWYFYLTRQDENSRILARLWSPMSILVVAITVATITVCQLGNVNISHYTPILSSSKNEEIELGSVISKDGGVEDCRGSREHKVAAGAFLTGITKERGRPSICNLLLPLIEVDSTRVFACGPASLMEDTRLAVNALRQECMYCCERQSTIELYEESFEM